MRGCMGYGIRFFSGVDCAFRVSLKNPRVVSAVVPGNLGGGKWVSRHVGGSESKWDVAFPG